MGRKIAKPDWDSGIYPKKVRNFLSERPSGGKKRLQWPDFGGAEEI
jgi:hypothetical protein